MPARVLIALYGSGPDAARAARRLEARGVDPDRVDTKPVEPGSPTARALIPGYRTWATAGAIAGFVVGGTVGALVGGLVGSGQLELAWLMSAVQPSAQVVGFTTLLTGGICALFGAAVGALVGASIPAPLHGTRFAAVEPTAVVVEPEGDGERLRDWLSDAHVVRVAPAGPQLVRVPWSRV